MRALAMRLLATALAVAVAVPLTGCSGSSGNGVPADIQAVFNKPLYSGATWGLRVVDLDNGRVLIDTQAGKLLYIGSVRKVFTVGELLEQVGADHRYNTPVYRTGPVDGSGVLDGNLILVASGDLTMGGRTNPDGSLAYTQYDHSEANTLGNAILTKPDPLAGYKALAAQVAAAGIREIQGDVVIDDRLFEPFNFRDQFNVRPIFVNDDLVDLTINPTTPGQPASVTWRPQSAALTVDNGLITGAAGSDYTLQLDSELPQCIGTPGCTAGISGTLPIDDIPPLTDSFPLVQTFRIVQPSNYARTVFVEALEADGVAVDAPTVEQNPTGLLPPKDSYPDADKVAELTGMTTGQDGELILKVSYNVGSDTSLVLWGLTQGVDTMSDALSQERENLAANYGIPSDEYSFVDGSGGGETLATTQAVTHMLADLHDSSIFPTLYDDLPILGVDGSLGFVTDFEADPTLAGAKGQVHAKTGTYALGSPSGILVKGRAMGGYITTQSGAHLAYALVVNNVLVNQVLDITQISQDQGTVSAMLWRDY